MNRGASAASTVLPPSPPIGLLLGGGEDQGRLILAPRKSLPANALELWIPHFESHWPKDTESQEIARQAVSDLVEEFFAEYQEAIEENVSSAESEVVRMRREARALRSGRTGQSRVVYDFRNRISQSKLERSSHLEQLAKKAQTMNESLSDLRQELQIVLDIWHENPREVGTTAFEALGQIIKQRTVDWDELRKVLQQLDESKREVHAADTYGIPGLGGQED